MPLNEPGDLESKASLLSSCHKKTNAESLEGHIGLLDTPLLKQLIFLDEQKKIKEGERNKIEAYVQCNPNAAKYPSIVDKRMRLGEELCKSDQLINATMRSILANESMKVQLRTLSASFFKLNSIVGALYTQDLHDIYKRGITESDITYIGDLSQLDEGIRRDASDRMAVYYLETAEQRIAYDARAEKGMASASSIEKSILNKECLLTGGIGVDEDEPSFPLYMADSAGLVNELLLNGADPIKESKYSSITPLTHQFALRYVIRQSLNGMMISSANVQAALKNNPAKALKAKLKNEAKKLKVDVDELKRELKNKETLIKAHIKAIVLRDSGVDPLHSADIARSEKYQRLWNDCKQEVEKMQRKKLTKDCTVQDFLTGNLAQLTVLPRKKLKSAAEKFPHFKSLLHRQITMLDNYRLVQGSSQVTRRVTDSNEEPVKEVKASRLARSTFFGAMPVLRPELTSEKKAEAPSAVVTTSRLHQSLLFFGETPHKVAFDSVSKQIEDQRLFSS